MLIKTSKWIIRFWYIPQSNLISLLLSLQKWTFGNGVWQSLTWVQKCVKNRHVSSSPGCLRAVCRGPKPASCNVPICWCQRLSPGGWHGICSGWQQGSRVGCGAVCWMCISSWKSSSTAVRDSRDLLATQVWCQLLNWHWFSNRMAVAGRACGIFCALVRVSHLAPAAHLSSALGLGSLRKNCTPQLEL